ncbi:hypothetical protein J5U18_01465 [Sphingobacteriaceae bacterium WQ 2009]|uniref:Lipoprotein n=1 Tax=Rhinopithecimicrobium faecis TaxID=2820698 RepID=A0A8T4H7I0_9SPHI|nr:hypothetical protein [Sphingobacteriaceae bacterium WQ 2009]
MKKVLLLMAVIVSICCSCKKDPLFIREQKVIVEFISNSDDIPVDVMGGNMSSKYIKKYHREVVSISSNGYGFGAYCEDPKTLLTIRVFDSKYRLLQERSGNIEVHVNEHYNRK